MKFIGSLLANVLITCSFILIGASVLKWDTYFTIGALSVATTIVICKTIYSLSKNRNRIKSQDLSDAKEIHNNHPKHSNLLKNTFLVIACISLIVISFSIAYYYMIFLPRQQLDVNSALQKIEQSSNNDNAQANFPKVQPTTDTSEIQDQLDNINNSIDNQNRDRQQQTDCESSGGIYHGNGMCVYGSR